MSNFGYKFQGKKTGKLLHFDFSFRERAQSILVTSVNPEGVEIEVLLSLKDFLPFFSEPDFRQFERRTTNLYSSMAFWLLDNTYGAIFFHNMSNHSIQSFSDAYMVDVKKDLTGLLPGYRDKRSPASMTYTDFQYEELSTTLETIFERGDLSFAPDPSIPYPRFGARNSDLHLEVINQMMVR